MTFNTRGFVLLVLFGFYAVLLSIFSLAYMKPSKAVLVTVNSLGEANLEVVLLTVFSLIALKECYLLHKEGVF